MTYVQEDIDLVGNQQPNERAAFPTREIRWRNSVLLAIGYLASVAVALGLSAALIVLTKHSPHDAFFALLDGAIKSKAAWGRTLEQASPLLIVALGSVVANRSGVFNIGQEGQVLIGAMGATMVALNVGGQSAVIVVLALCAAFIAGAIWAGIAAALKLWRNVDVVITTLLLIFIANQFVQFAVTRKWFLQQSSTLGIAAPQSDNLPKGVHLPRFGSPPNFYLQGGLLIGLALAVLLSWLFARTRWGFRLRMLGLNPNAARRAGVGLVAVGGGALLISGGLAGVAGGVTLTSTVFSLQPGLANNYGWDGLLVALVARNRPAPVVGVAVFFGALRAGGGFLATTGVPSYLVNIVQALLVLSTLFPPIFMSWRERRLATRVSPTVRREDIK